MSKVEFDKKFFYFYIGQQIRSTTTVRFRPIKVLDSKYDQSEAWILNLTNQSPEF